MSTPDRRFIDFFTIVISLLVGTTFVLFILARYLAAGTQNDWIHRSTEVTTAVNDRLKPFGQVVVEGQDTGPAATTALAPAAPVAAPLSGPQVYNAACIACHGAGIGGAPKFGDKAIWAPRVAQGAATLQSHALKGFQGTAGVMPPKGGRIDLSDQEISAAVDYMVGQSR